VRGNQEQQSDAKNGQSGVGLCTTDVFLVFHILQILGGSKRAIAQTFCGG
jgi:hypothetical protein